MAGEGIKLHHDGLSRPLENPHLRVLSLGAGVQSTTLALMAARGEIEVLDFAVFADTGWEPKAVYRHLDWLESVVPFPIYRVRRKGPDLGELTLSVARGERSQAGHWRSTPTGIRTEPSAPPAASRSGPSRRSAVSIANPRSASTARRRTSGRTAVSTTDTLP